MSDYNDSASDIASTLAEILPAADALTQIEAPEGVKGLQIIHYAVPKNSDVKEFKVDLEALLPNPRATKATANFADFASFLAYVRRHATEGSVVWCNYDPQTFALDFTAVFDEHTKDAAGWRRHKALFKPDFSVEWKAWKGADRKTFPQVEFAEWIQEHEDDIQAAQGLPTSLQMHEMATNFVMNEDRVLKSAVRLQSGGVNLTYIADPDKGTTEAMKLFEKFSLGIPVFHGKSAWSITARLKYRNNGGKLSFSYELIRADRVHKGAAEELIDEVRKGLVAVPLLMGACA